MALPDIFRGKFKCELNYDHTAGDVRGGRSKEHSVGRITSYDILFTRVYERCVLERVGLSPSILVYVLPTDDTDFE